MSREVRRVPKDWEHPRDQNGKFIPMHQKFPYNENEIREGIRDGWLIDEPPFYGIDVMPQWPEEEKTHWQMYETTSEGRPISPVMETPEDLARWLADTKASAFADRTATYEEWLSTIRRGGSVGAVFGPGIGFLSGVEYEARLDRNHEGER